MESVGCRRTRFGKKKIVYLSIFLMYFLGGAAFVYFGLQPATSAQEVYAKEQETATAHLSIPSIGIDLPVTKVELKGKDLTVPEQIAGSYSAHQNKTLLIGHSSTAFKSLPDIKLNDKLTYLDKEYYIADIETKDKSSISMKQILKPEEEDTIVLMTCAGQEISARDYTERLIVTAKRL